MEKHADLGSYNNNWYQPGGTKFKRLCWFVINALFFNSYLLPAGGVKVSMLRLFGAKMGSGVVIKPKVNIKYPWHLAVGNNCWIGEQVWIDNLTTVQLGNNVCLSQGAMLLTGNHNYKASSFDLMIGQITLDDAVWIGAQALVCPGVHCNTHAVLTAKSVATADLEAFGIYQGNPAQFIKKRIIE